ncbi:MAG: hypothetical protein KJ792_03040 [Actinobacteria bacterium]|nr:hypothetical protein [Actinomycetota bacterium]MCG2803359.1 hypothetical protein [Cellulomonas sp.]
MPAPQKSQDATKANVLAAIGVVLALVGGLGARLGTTNLGLFIVYVVLLLAGIVTIGASQRVRNRKYED